MGNSTGIIQQLFMKCLLDFANSKKKKYHALSLHDGQGTVLGDYMHYLIYASNSPIRLAELLSLFYR